MRYINGRGNEISVYLGWDTGEVVVVEGLSVYGPEVGHFGDLEEFKAWAAREGYALVR